MPLNEQQLAAFDNNGFVVVPGFVPPEIGLAIEAEVITAIRNDPPSAHPGAPVYQTSGELFIQPEQKPNPAAVNAEDHISKVFNPHLGGLGAAFAMRTKVADIVEQLIGEPTSVFQSQFIFKNPGAWGQPWHQDAFYFPFDRRPEIGVWLAISEATLENGCLAVIPGGHRSAVHPHGPDLRPGANYGYTEIAGLPEDQAIPVLMQPGDCLFFHSLLPHRSYDNTSSARRSALVCHYTARTAQMTAPPSPAQQAILRFRPVGRAA